MKIKVETEKKYYLMEPEWLLKKAQELNFKQVKQVFETDEYFTDINSEYIKNRTCLRIRKQDNKAMEITFKGKSNVLSGQYCKLENNILCEVTEYDNFLKLFTSLGYYSYVTVEKERIIYQLKNEKYTYNIMVDKLINIGGFVEFEIISEKDDSNKAELNKELERFLLKFKEFNLTEANEPYRDIVANNIYNKVVKIKNASNIYINVDEEILKYEKEFFKKYKDKISTLCNINTKWGMYKKNANISDKLEVLIDEYLENLIFDSKELLVTVELLSKLDYNNCFITKVNQVFFEKIFKKLNISHRNVIYLKEESLSKILKNNIDSNNSIVILNNDIKSINSTLLVIINNR